MKKVEPHSWAMQLFHIMSLKGTVQLVDELGEHARTFSALAKETGLDEATLMRRLQVLHALGLIMHKPAVVKKRETKEYSLSEVGLDLLRFIAKQEARFPKLSGRKAVPTTLVQFEEETRPQAKR